MNHGKIVIQGLHVGIKLGRDIYETQTGIYDADAGVFHALPITGYMADKRFRTQALKITNLISRLPFLIFSGSPFIHMT